MNGAPIHSVYQYAGHSPVQQQRAQQDRFPAVQSVPPVLPSASSVHPHVPIHSLSHLHSNMHQHQHQHQQRQQQQQQQTQAPAHQLSHHAPQLAQYPHISHSQISHLSHQQLSAQQHQHQPPHHAPQFQGHRAIFHSPPNYSISHFAANVAPIPPRIPSAEKESTLYQKELESLPVGDTVKILTTVTPSDIREYNEHLYKIATILYTSKADSAESISSLKNTYYELIDDLDKYIKHDDPVNSQLHLLIERNFDVFIKISTNHKDVDVSTRTIRFLTNIIMNLNYWEIYNLLSWKPAIYHFLSIIQFDLNECYYRFINDYAKFNYNRIAQPQPSPEKATALRESRKARRAAAVQRSTENDYRGETPDSDNSSIDDDSSSQTPSGAYSSNHESFEHDKYLSENLAGLTPKEKKKRVDAKIAAHKIIKKTTALKQSTKSSNYDPDVVHECQLPSPDEPHKVCLRRFSRKYELIRHQETVHSKKKKLFKCYVCVKQNPSVGPRIFTRHDTLAKHIRVNHKISGKEAKAEVAYSKKHAEVVEEGDITVHVGRRKTKVDFELRAHMEKKKMAKDSPDMDDSGFLDTNSELDSGDEEVVFNN